MAHKVTVEIKIIEPPRPTHPQVPIYFVSMNNGKGTWEETCFGREHLDLCLRFLQAGVTLSSEQYFSLPEIPK
jgi:hypothetical protein